MGKINQNDYDLIRAETTRLIWQYGGVLIKSHVLEEKKEIELEVGTLESMRLQGYGPSCVKLGDKSNSHIVYRVDHIAAYNLDIDYNPTIEESKLMLQHAMSTKYVKKYYDRAEIATMYGFTYQTVVRHYNRYNELKEMERCGIVVEYPSLINPPLSKLSKKSRSRFNYELNDILDHICTLPYIQTMS